ncbi:hypothetical protein B0J14DRAFT_597311 [Halenospora varia]|nr:hypothetical protein B0J14DRAFT_597311 [Halenospora varia]
MHERNPQSESHHKLSSRPTMTASSTIQLRLPSTFTSSKNAVPIEATPILTTEQLSGTWFIMKTSIPFWKDKRNASITLTKSTTGKTPNALDNLTTYHLLPDPSQKKIRGADTATKGLDNVYDWRGHGWLKIASSRWEVLGSEQAGNDDGWLVVYTHGSMFTTGGLIVYSRRSTGLSQDVGKSIEDALRELGSGALSAEVTNCFEVPRN